MEERLLKPVGFEQITVTGGFWKEKQDLVGEVTVGAVYDQFEETGRFRALKMDWKEGDPCKPHIFWDSDVAKWIEGASCFLQKRRDADLEKKIDELVELMEKNQASDGYFNTYFEVVEPKARFLRRRDHELYCLGHLIEGAIAYDNATGKKAMLRVAIRYADLADRVFRVEHSAAFDTPGHEEVELALIRLYRHTGEQRYLKLAAYFLDTRGRSQKDMTGDNFCQGAEYSQSHLPIREQKTAEGHSVRALYLYCAMADMALVAKEERLWSACRILFENITQKRMYITGGVGSTWRGEAFTYDYDLPEYQAYCETCASIALAMFCRRMWLIEPDGSYGDCAERALYNTVLSGVSLTGDRFFYENPLAADPRHHDFNASRPEALRERLPIMERVKVFDCSCCPPNLIRTVGAIADYMYSVSEDTVYAHCYMEAEAKLCLGEKQIRLIQKTEYPYEGKVEITVETAGRFTLALRIPWWSETWSVSVGKETLKPAVRKGYVYISRDWEKGDTVCLMLDMQVKWWAANPHVSDVCGRVAITRGPLVYCAEGIDNPDWQLRAVRVARRKRTEVRMETIGGALLPVLYVQASSPRMGDALYTPRQPRRVFHSLKLIPYFAWANHGRTEMTTWFLEE